MTMTVSNNERSLGWMVASP